MDEDPGSAATRLVRRAAEILDEELTGARARAGHRPGRRAEPTDRRALADELHDAVTAGLDQALEGIVDGVVDVVAALVDRAATWTPDGVALVVAPAPVVPGGTVSLVVPVPTGPDGRPGATGPVLVTALLGPGQGRIAASAVTWNPDRLEDVGPEGLAVTVRIPPRTRAGDYRMLLRGSAGFEAVVGVTVG